jgi:hypothetical protein
VELHRGINFSRLEVPADAGGVMFVVGSVVVLLVAVPAFRWFLAGALALGVVLAALMHRWRDARS